MPETTIATFTVLKCACGGDLFTPIIKLKYKNEGGTIPEPAGHWCVACHAVVDNKYMISLVDRQKKQEEIRRLQAEIGPAPEPPQTATAKVGAAR
jgi:hypothetical protein